MPVETLEVEARLVVPVTLEIDGETEVEHRIEATTRVSDQIVPPDPVLGYPGDPDDLPPSTVTRERLESECAEQLAALVSDLTEREQRRLLRKAEAAFREGDTESGIELAVRALLETQSTVPYRGAVASLRQRSLLLLQEWTSISPRALEAVLPQ